MNKTNKYPNHLKHFAAKKLVLYLSIVSLLFTLFSCGGEKGVPDAFAIESAGKCKYVTPKYPSTTDVIHNKYDSESYLDYVTIASKSEGDYGSFVSTRKAIFQYDRTSDLWSLFDIEPWTEPDYTFNKRLVGKYDVKGEVDYENIICHIEILSVTEESIQLKYNLSADVDIAFEYFESLHIEVSGKETLSNGEFFVFVTDDNPHLSIPIELPEGYCDGYHDADISLILEIDLTYGIQTAHVLGSAHRCNCRTNVS